MTLLMSSMGKPNLEVVPWASGDRQYFTDEEAYQSYLKREAEVAKEPLDFVLDWRYLLRVLFHGGDL